MLAESLHPAIIAHQPKLQALPLYDKHNNDDIDRLYIRLWQHLVAKHAKSVAFSHLMRCWAMAAIFAGLAVALLLWAAVITYLSCKGLLPLSVCQSAFFIGLILGAVIITFHQGGKYYEYQVEDLVAALAVATETIDHAPRG